MIRVLTIQERITIAVALAATVATAVLTIAHATPVLTFVVAAAGLGALAATVGDAIEQLGSRISAGATGVVQSTVANLPELFVSLFALRAGLTGVVKAALVGSILANSLLVLGLAFAAGGLKHGVQRFESEPPRLIATLMLLGVAAMAVPTFAGRLHTPAAEHEGALAITCALVLLAVFALSIPYSLRAGSGLETAHVLESPWPTRLVVIVLVGASLSAALVSDWFVEALEPAIVTLHLSQAFTGLVIVAIASNAVENFVGIKLAMANRSDLAVSVIMNSPLQTALGLTPALVLISLLPGFTHLDLVLSPLLVACLAIGSIVSAVVVFDGESIWLEGVALVGLYGIMSAAFWWG